MAGHEEAPVGRYHLALTVHADADPVRRSTAIALEAGRGAFLRTAGNYLRTQKTTRRLKI
jgi:hypothetical protein